MGCLAFAINAVQLPDIRSLLLSATALAYSFEMLELNTDIHDHLSAVPFKG